MSKKSKIIISIIGVLLFVAIVVSGTVSYYVLNENNQLLSSVYVKYENLPYIMQDDAVYIKKDFFEVNEFDFVIEKEDYFDDEYFDEVKLNGARIYTTLYYLDLTRKNAGINYYKFWLIRREDSDKIPMELTVFCDDDLTVLFNAKKYGGCRYEYYDPTRSYCIQANTGSKKCEITLHIDVKQSYNFSQEELNSIYEDVVHSLIDNLITYNEISARGGV